jgi:pyridinium-3,5-biscarboxylic acid mononucleotide sulfurtransferase
VAHRLGQWTARGFAALFSGANVDDLEDRRPGLRAAEHGVRHPLVESGFGKAHVRAFAHELELPSADKPAMPCLASRLPFGTHVDPDILAQVDHAERALKGLGFRELRVRHLGTTGRVELGADDLSRERSPSIALRSSGPSWAPGTRAWRSTPSRSARARSLEG